MRSMRRLHVVLAAISIAAGISCSADNSLTAPQVSAPSPSLIGGLLDGLGKAPLVSPLLSCTPQPYAADTLVVGPAGGTLKVGRHSLAIPAGALNAPVQIIADAPVGEVVSVRFEPEGLKFNPARQPVLTLDYSACPPVRNLLPKRIVYTTETLDILSLLPSIDNLLTKRVSAPLEHFSRYVVAF
jgi:hypothetical protein